MKIFKNRGSIYIPKSNMKSDREQKFLFACLGVLITGALVVLIIFGVRYHFSLKEFFRPNDLQTAAETGDTAAVNLPDVSGKTNFVILETDNDAESLHFALLVQFDMDSNTYKAAAVGPDIRADNIPLDQAYEQGGAAAVLRALNEEFSLSVDNYFTFTDKNFTSMFDELGSATYAFTDSIRDELNGDDGFYVRVSAGEQKVDGDLCLRLIRYWCQIQNDYTACNNFLVSMLTELFNDELYTDRLNKFSAVINLVTDTDMTVNDYTELEDVLQVACSEFTGMNVYYPEAQAQNGSFTDDSVQSIRSSFSK